MSVVIGICLQIKGYCEEISLECLHRNFFMDREDPFRSLLRRDREFSKTFVRRTSPPNAVQTFLQREQKRPSTGTTRVIVSSKPPTICINCSRASSLCMSCHELAMGKALQFQRKSTLLGAVSFFKRAVKEAGHTRLVKLAVFRLWKNGFRIRAQQANRLKMEADKRYMRQVAGPTFNAWRKMIRDIVVRRKERKIEELNSKLKQLEDVIKRLNAMIP